MEYNTLVFIGEYGPVIGQYPLPEKATDAERKAVLTRYVHGCSNPSCIAAFWYVNGTMKQYVFLRA